MIEDYPEDKYSPSCLILGLQRITGRCVSRFQNWINLTYASSRSMNQMKMSGQVAILFGGNNDEPMSSLWINRIR